MADKVLIVDDDVDCLQLTGELLLEWDYRVITAASGAVTAASGAVWRKPSASFPI